MIIHLKARERVCLEAAAIDAARIDLRFLYEELFMAQLERIDALRDNHAFFANVATYPR